MTRRFIRFCAIMGGTVLALATQAGNWPGWRGPTGDGVCYERDLPIHWSTTENVKWRVALPDRGNSTPVVWANRVFVTQAIERENRSMLMCFDRSSGKLLWQKGVTAPKDPSHEENPVCSSSPVTDGERVIVSFASSGLYCFDFDGNEIWHREFGPQHHIWGAGASPMLHGDLCIQNFGPGANTLLVALNKKTGQTVWHHVEETGYKEPSAQDPNANVDWVGSWSTPIVRAVDGRDELLMSYPRRVCAFDPATGSERWTCDGLNPLVYTSPLYHDGIVVGMGGYNGMALAVKAGGSGNVTMTHRLWQNPKTRQRIGSGVIASDYIYILTDPGIAECIELKTGKYVWEERTQGPAATSQNWSSLLLADGKLYAVNKGGDAFVFRASPKFEVVATNSISERVIGSMAASDGELFIRSYSALWCIGKK